DWTGGRRCCSSGCSNRRPACLGIRCWWDSRWVTSSQGHVCRLDHRMGRVGCIGSPVRRGTRYLPGRESCGWCSGGHC
ncbi:hypothetical protein BaRGS_00018146, partial [Batillaria attramentaria]